MPIIRKDKQGLPQPTERGDCMAVARKERRQHGVEVEGPNQHRWTRDDTPDGLVTIAHWQAGRLLRSITMEQETLLALVGSAGVEPVAPVLVTVNGEDTPRPVESKPRAGRPRTKKNPIDN